MTDRKLLALALVVFVLFASVTGGFSYAVLTDTEVVTLTVGNSGNVAAAGNTGPVAVAGPDATVAAGGTATLDATGSEDPDGSITAYAWTITGGEGTLAAANTATPTYEAPADADTATSAAVELTVTASDGETATDTVVVGIETRDTGAGGVVFVGQGAAQQSNGRSAGLRVLAENGTDPSTLATGRIAAVGPRRADFDGDGSADVPYVKNGNAIRLVDGDGKRRTLDVSGARVDTTKTRLSVGSWEGAGPSVLYAGNAGTGIYRVGPDAGPTAVAAPESGVASVAGPGDVDGDGADELVFAGGSGTVRYVDDDGGVGSTGVTAGSNANVGIGRPTDFDGDGRASVPVVDGSGAVELVDAAGVETTLVDGTGDEAAAETPVAPADVDGDGAPEVVYLDATIPAGLRYVDDVRGSNDVGVVHDGTGSEIEPDRSGGVS